ncbi:hypothetical protein [Streptococcus loxodontisalivarius]|uniref:Uncharacterized protein n=2 Tax=Streptococcus loxodontisalivarius TaxID=1349415 RepID=A0ABS2PRS7_9STRE|nr:hypothetical protein [Streptococcus loxodontisalivarius]MBM7642737.1 hypothetical protein [Streptococcus loxodontisalivarius]
MNRESESLEDIAEELGRIVERRMLSRRSLFSPLYIRMLLTVCTLVILAILIKASQNIEFKVSSPEYTEERNLKTYVEGLYENVEQKEFLWTYEDFEELDVSFGQSEAQLLQIIEKYGRPNDTYYRSYPNEISSNEISSIVITYSKTITESPLKTVDVKLTFLQSGEDISLQVKSARNLYQLPNIENYDIKSWSTQDVDQMIVGSSSDGTGGSSIDQVLEKFGKPSDTSTFVMGSSLDSSLQCTVSLDYEWPDTQKSSFTFIENSGQFLLTNKSME